VQALTAASLSREIGRGLIAFGELFYGSRDERDGSDQAGLDAGILWIVTRDLALDVACSPLDAAGSARARRRASWSPARS
jgi:hypothetical protein